MKKERIKNFEIKVEHKNITISDITRCKADRIYKYQYTFSYDIEIENEENMSRYNRIIDANDLNDFKEKLISMFTRALNVGGYISREVPEKIRSQLENFIPSTTQFKIPRTSYQVQLGTVNDKWTSNLLKNHLVIASFVYKDENLGEFGLPNPNDIIKWILKIIPDLEAYRLVRVVKTLIEQTILKKLYPKAVMPISKFTEYLSIKPELHQRKKIEMKIGEKKRIMEELEQLLNDPNIDIDFRVRLLIDKAFLSFYFLFAEDYESEWYQLAQNYIAFLKSKNK